MKKKALDPATLETAIESFSRKSPPPPRTRYLPAKGFPSDRWVEAFPDLGHLPEASETTTAASLLGGPEILLLRYIGGLKILAECPEFRLLQFQNPDGIMRVERSYAVERAHVKSLTAVNDSDGAGGWEHRAALTLALRELSLFTAANMAALVEIRESHPALHSTNRGDPMATVVPLAATLGLAIEQLWESKDPKGTIGETLKYFEAGLRGFARCESLSRDNRRRNGPRVHHLIDTAERIFEESRERPSKSAVIEQVKRFEHLNFSGKNSNGKWKDLFLASGLANLPD